MNSKKTKICIIRCYYFPQETHLKRDVKALLEQGYEVDVICLCDIGQKLYEVWNGVNVYRIPIKHLRRGLLRYIAEYFIFFTGTAILLTLLFFKKNYNIIEVDTMPDFLVFSTLIPKIFGAKIILYLFENVPVLFARKLKISLHHPLVKLLGIIENLSVKFSHKIIITCVRKEKYFENANILLNVPDETMFLPEGFTFSNKNRKISNVYGNGDKTLIMTHSTITEIYGIQNIIYALSILVPKYPKIKCEILGEGEYLPVLRKIVETYYLTNNVIFKSFVPFENLSTHLCQADLGIISLLIEYLLPNKLFEYIALGIPVICAEHNTIRNFFTEDELTFYNAQDYRDLAEKIEWAMFNREAILKKSEAALKKYKEHYCWEKSKKIYIDCYKSLGGKK